MERTITIKGTAKDIAKLEAMLAIINLEIVTTTAKAESPKETPKAKKTSSKKKSDDNFDRALYESIAKELGVLGKHGVYKACRPTVYKVMDGSLTKAKAKKEVEAWKKSNPWATK